MKHLFVVTYGRSGSTVLLNLLNAIDGYCIRGENQGVLKQLGIAASQTRKVAEEYKPKEPGVEHPWYGIDLADTDGFERALADAFVRYVLVPPANARVTGFKEIRYTPQRMSDEEFDQVIAFMLTAFDDARIVFNTRDWRQVAKSGWWAKLAPRKVRRIVGACDERFRRAHARYPERTFMIDHARFNGNPDGFSPLLQWLGETPDRERVRAVSETRLVHLVKPRKAGSLRRSLNRLTGRFGAGD